MRVALVNPPRPGGIPAVREERHEFRLRQSILYPLSLLQVAALLEREGHQALVLDANARDLDAPGVARRVAELAPDLVVTRFAHDSAASDLAFVPLLKAARPQAVVVARSRVVDLGRLDRELLVRFPDLDAFARGELEALVPRLAAGLPLEAVEGLTLAGGRRIGGAPRVADWGSLPLPAFHLLPDLRPYGRRNRSRRAVFAMLESSRGCPYGCHYCLEARTGWRARPADRVAEDLEALGDRFGVGHVQFQDETFTVDRRRVLDLARLLPRPRVTWECNTRPDLVDPELLRAMAGAGCRRIHFGVESLQPEVLRRASRGMGPEVVERAARAAWRAGIAPGASVLVGLPGDSREGILQTARRLRRLPLAGGQFNLAFPYPGTPLHQEALERGWVRPGQVEWSALDPTLPVLEYPGLPPAELAELRRRCLSLYYLHPMRLVVGLGLLRSAADLEDLLRRALNLLGKALRGFQRDR